MPTAAKLTSSDEFPELTNGSVLRFLARYPLMPLQVLALIHWQALKLFVRGVPFHHKPPFEAGRGSLRP